AEPALSRRDQGSCPRRRAARLAEFAHGQDWRQHRQGLHASFLCRGAGPGCLAALPRRKDSLGRSRQRPAALPGGSMRQTTAHIIDHTHWDREWFLAATYASRWIPQLIERIEALAAANRDFRYLFDGQTLVLED